VSKSELSLYGITDEFLALDAMLEMDEGEISESYEALVQEATSLIQLKTDSYVGYVNHQKDLVILAKDKIKTLQVFIKAREKHIERLNSYVADCMDKIDVKKIEGKLCEIKERAPLKVLHIEDENDVPAEFTTVETVVKINKAELKKAVKNGDISIHGIELVNGKRSISFKLKSVKG
jgi:hypothetical protein